MNLAWTNNHVDTTSLRTIWATSTWISKVILGETNSHCGTGDAWLPSSTTSPRKDQEGDEKRPRCESKFQTFVLAFSKLILSFFIYIIYIDDCCWWYFSLFLVRHVTSNMHWKCSSSNLTKLPSCSARLAKVCTLFWSKIYCHAMKLEPSHRYLNPTSSQISKTSYSQSIYSIYSRNNRPSLHSSRFQQTTNIIPSRYRKSSD